MKGVYSRLLALLLGAVAALLLAEAALRLAHTAFGGRVSVRGPVSGRTVLCLGDSFTFGSGAPAGYGYPEQLERLLNSEGGARVAVINGGVLGQNTAQVLEGLEADLAAARPALVVLLAGGANMWNLYGYNSYAAGGPLAGESGLQSKLKIFRLVRVLRGLLASPAAGVKTPQCQPSGRAVLDFYKRAEAAAAAGDYGRALAQVEQAARLEPDNAQHCRNAAELSEKLGQTGAARRWREKERHAPSDCQVSGRKPYFSNEFKPEEAIRGWISGDISRIAGVCGRRGVPLLLLNYPLKNKKNRSYLPEIYAAAAASSGLPLVDNYSVFEKLDPAARRLYSRDPFGHCNEDGYGVMAGNVAAAIKKYGFLIAPAPPAATGR